MAISLKSSLTSALRLLSTTNDDGLTFEVDPKFAKVLVKNLDFIHLAAKAVIVEGTFDMNGPLLRVDSQQGRY